MEKNAPEAISSYQKGFGSIEKVEDTSPAAAFALYHEVHESWSFVQSVAEGSEHGLARLGLMFRHGHDFENDYYEAIRLLLLAEKKGSKVAAVELGKIYFEGDQRTI